jgi:hypothetical protein
MFECMLKVKKSMGDREASGNAAHAHHAGVCALIYITVKHGFTVI